MKNEDGKGEKPTKIEKKGIEGESLTQNNKYKQCPRLWRYSINEK